MLQTGIFFKSQPTFRRINTQHVNNLANENQSTNTAAAEVETPGFYSAKAANLQVTNDSSTANEAVVMTP